MKWIPGEIAGEGNQETGDEIHIDKEGQWFFKGAPIIRQDVVSFLSQHLVGLEDGSYEIHWKGQVCRVSVEDTPFVVCGVTPLKCDGRLSGVLLELNDGTTEMLAPDSLSIGFQNVPYCKVRNGRFRARFSRKAYYQLARMIEEMPGAEEGFCLRLGDKTYPIHQA